MIKMIRLYNVKVKREKERWLGIKLAGCREVMIRRVEPKLDI